MPSFGGMYGPLFCPLGQSGHEHLGALDEINDHRSEGEPTPAQNQQTTVSPSRKENINHVQRPPQQRLSENLARCLGLFGGGGGNGRVVRR